MKHVAKTIYFLIYTQRMQNFFFFSLVNIENKIESENSLMHICEMACGVELTITLWLLMGRSKEKPQHPMSPHQHRNYEAFKPLTIS